MNTYLENLRTKIQNEITRLNDESHRIQARLRSKRDDRRAAASCCIENYLPNLSKSALNSLQTSVPGFELPIIYSGFEKFLMAFGFSQSGSLDSTVSLASLRIQLGNYLDNSSYGGNMPKEWTRKVYPLDQSILMLQAESARQNAEKLSEARNQLASVEKLIANKHKLGPDNKACIDRISKGQIPLRRGVPVISPTASTYRETSTDNSSGGISFLDVWLLNEIMSHGSDIHSDMTASPGVGGGQFGGAGATGSIPDDVPSEQSSGSSMNVDDIGSHMSVGAGSFS